MLKPSDVFPKSLSAALEARGQYVYAYYRPGSFKPFYVGKGSGLRALAHWYEALKDKPQNLQKEQEKEIISILKSGNIPHISLLAYNLDESIEDRHSIAERVLQDAFGIQSVVEKTPGGNRIIGKAGELLQKREDSAKRRPLSLESVLAMHAERAGDKKTITREYFQKLATEMNAPILLVGVIKTYRSSYQDCHLREMSRMYWNLGKYANTHLKSLLTHKNAILIAWTSGLSADAKKTPVIVGTWRINGKQAKLHKSPHSTKGRYAFPANDDFSLKQSFLGNRLAGTGLNWQGQYIFAP